jgi:hypothetical protein
MRTAVISGRSWVTAFGSTLRRFRRRFHYISGAVVACAAILGSGTFQLCQADTTYYYFGGPFDPDPSHNLQRGVDCNHDTIFYKCVSGVITAKLVVKSDESTIDSSQTDFSFTLSGPGVSLKSTSPDVVTYGSGFRISGGTVVAWNLTAYRVRTNHDWLLQTCYACGSSIAFDNSVETLYQLRDPAVGFYDKKLVGSNVNTPGTWTVIPQGPLVLVCRIGDITETTTPVTGGETAATIPLGAIFSLQLGNKMDDTISPIDSTFSISDQHTNPSISEPTLFKDHQIIEFDKSSSDTIKSFQAIHLGDALATISPSDGSSPVKVRITVVPPAALGTSHNDVDDVLVDFAHRRGVPPHLFKGLVRRESNFRPDAYRYEPLKVDLGAVSHGANVRANLPYSRYRLATADGLALGTDIIASDISPRSRYSIVRLGVLRPIAPADVLVSALEIYQHNDHSSHWAIANPMAAHSVAVNQNLLQFTAQTPLAASFGFIQLLYTTAIAPMGWRGVDGDQNPSFLFDLPENRDGGGSLEAATGYLRRVYASANPSVSQTSPDFPSAIDLAESYSRAFNVYNHSSAIGRYGPNVLGASTEYLPTPASTIFATP